jgi:AcrR family transcriptional regulator
MTSPTPSKRDGAATRQKLLRAALELFTTIGFRATTTPEIAARAGVAEGTIYRHFSGKEELLNAAYREAQSWGLELIRGQDGDKTLPPRDRLLEVALQQIVASGKSDGLVRPGPADLWTSVWLALVAFAAERVSAKEWSPDHQQVGLTLEAAWNAISAGKRGSGETGKEES